MAAAMATAAAACTSTNNARLMTDLHLHPLLASVVYSVLGIALLVISFFVFDKLTPGTLRKEILEDQNTALAILGAAFMLAVALIISAAIHG